MIKVGHVLIGLIDVNDLCLPEDSTSALHLFSTVIFIADACYKLIACTRHARWKNAYDAVKCASCDWSLRITLYLDSFALNLNFNHQELRV